jgi:penicillin amidase
MPQLADPERGWIATANNRPAPEDFPYPLSGTWSDGLRATRIRHMLELNYPATYERFARMQQDTKSLRAVKCVPALMETTFPAAKLVVAFREAMQHLANWDCRMEPDRIGAAIFDVFFSHWTKAVARERFDEETAAFLSGGVNGLSAALLPEDSVGWFAKGRRNAAILEAMEAAIEYLTKRLGPDMSHWQWGKIHILTLRHILSGRGDLGQLLDHGGVPVPGDAQTVCNTGLGAQFESRMGAGYRLIADLSTSPPELFAVDSQSQSGHPGSPHYRDQLPTWMRGEHHRFILDGKGKSGSRLTLAPK